MPLSQKNFLNVATNAVRDNMETKTMTAIYFVLCTFINQGICYHYLRWEDFTEHHNNYKGKSEKTCNGCWLGAQHNWVFFIQLRMNWV